MRIITDEFGYWFAGFVDSKGYFGQGPVFEIKLRHDDQKVLEYVKDNLGFGNVYPSWQNSTIENAKPQIIFRVGSIPASMKLVTVLDAYPLRSKKYSEYKVWKQIVLVKHRDYDSPQDHTTLKELAEKLREIKCYNPKS